MTLNLHVRIPNQNNSDSAGDYQPLLVIACLSDKPLQY
jgi:hypothetical protein